MTCYATQSSEIGDAYLSTEIRAGLTTFATMAYIIAVNVRVPNLLRCVSHTWSRQV
jgi:hypothetical protein